MNKPWIKLLFSIAITVSSIPSIYKDFTTGMGDSWTHYGMLLVGVMYFLQSLFWILDLYESKEATK